VIDKPLRKTSMDVCRVVRRRLVLGGAPKRVKVGHGGTLDPLATGVLVVMVGKATRLCEQVMVGQKVYQTTIDLSAFSTTDDLEGEKMVPATMPKTPPSREAIEAALRTLTGEIMQRPPAYSAIKVDGQRAYDLARKGREVTLAARPVRVDAITIEQYAWPMLTLSITCGKGVYIRALARSLGEALGTGGHLIALRRTRVGQWTIEMSQRLESLPPVMSQTCLQSTS
jgi:tRNA pseudouridine55 synthase